MMELKTLTKKERDKLSPSDVLKRLMWGNFRFNLTKTNYGKHRRIWSGTPAVVSIFGNFELGNTEHTGYLSSTGRGTTGVTN